MPPFVLNAEHQNCTDKVFGDTCSVKGEVGFMTVVDNVETKFATVTESARAHSCTLSKQVQKTFKTI